MRILRLLLTTIAIVAGLQILQLAHAAGIDDARMKAAASDTGNWLLHSRDYTNQRFSPLDQVNAKTVKRLVPKWIYQTGTAATFQTTPLVADGVMYLSAPFSHVMAVDAATGAELWRYEHKSTAKKLCCGPANRGVALGYGKVYVATVDARLIALDQKTGAVLWDIAIVSPDGDPTEDATNLARDKLKDQNVAGSTGVGAVAAPLVANGLVITGITGVGYGLHLDSNRPGAPLGAVVGFSGRFGRPGFLAAYDAATGKKVWHFDTTQEGWDGEYRSTTPDGVPLNRDIAAEKAAAKDNKDAWRFGGGSIWHTPALDTERGVIFLGLGNPSPQAAGEGRPGDNLYTSSLVAIELKTGKLLWHYQQIPHDIWGLDVASPPVLFDAKVGAETIPAVGQASKLGWFYVHDRATGKLLYKSEAFVPQENMFSLPTPEGVKVSPGVGGGANWSPVSLDTANNRAFIAAMHLPTTYRSAEIPAADGKPAIKYVVLDTDTAEKWGTLTALDLAANGKILWQQKTKDPLVGGVLATAGGLVFNGEGSGDFAAYDAATGEKLWRFACGAGVNAPPISYAIDGKQYVAVAAGGSQRTSSFCCKVTV
ncbi:MAG TPA: PQQ-binding-like beta-propeller repeat protein, partial [Hyphomicrobium sp.]|nr:PQQ-binding-like beta-propeller repeat protein [Hyphomicrobium sp.]